jgi:hypothetical protein
MQLERIRSYRLNIFNQGRRKQVGRLPPEIFINGAGLAPPPQKKKFIGFKKIIKNYCEILQTGVFETVHIDIIPGNPARRQPWESSFLTLKSSFLKFVPQSTLLKVYNAIVLSHFDYCSLVWDNYSDYLLNKLQKLQNRAARVITGRTYETRYKDVLKELNWQPLSERLNRNKCIFMHKIKNNVIPQSVIEMFKIKENQVYQLRSNNINFSLGKPITNFMKNNISYSAASLWNSLPSLAKEQNSLSKFKSILDRS